MQEFDQFDFSQVRFDSDTMQVLSLSRHKQHFDLPVVRGPVNFTVMRSDGKFSNRWGVTVNHKGDGYVYRRDNPNAEKVSLHASGKQHVSIREDLAKTAGVASRFANMWNEPEFDAEAVATFSLVFPPWGVGLEASDFPGGFKRDELWIVGHREKVIVVAFFVVDSARNMQGRLPHVVLAELPVRQGKTLHIIAWKEPEGELMEMIKRTFPYAGQRLAELDLSTGDYTMNVQGYRRADSAYMVVFPVRYTSPKS